MWPGHPDYVAMDGSLDLHHDKWVSPTHHTHEHIHYLNGTHSSDVIAMARGRPWYTYTCQVFPAASFRAPIAFWPHEAAAWKPRLARALPWTTPAVAPLSASALGFRSHASRAQLSGER